MNIIKGLILHVPEPLWIFQILYNNMISFVCIILRI